ncbi:MAG: carbohydrate-binding domain-containing protein [Kiritimatiellia bacterium]
MKTKIALILPAVLISLLIPAAEFTVPGSYPDLTTAIQSAPDGSTIVVENGTYGFVNVENNTKNLLVISRNGPEQTVIDGGGTTRLLRVENGSQVAALNKQIVFKGFGFKNGRQFGSGVAEQSAVTIANASPQFLNCVFENNQADTKGGAVLIYGSATHPVFVDCVFRNNQAKNAGGAVQVSGGSPHPQATFRRCTFENNTTRVSGSNAYSQGGAIIFSQGSGRIFDSTFTGNSTAYAGGAIQMLNHWNDPNVGTLLIEGCVFENNHATDYPGFINPGLPDPVPPAEGGALMIESKVLVTVQGSRFLSNTAETGGAVMIYRGQANFSASIFQKNTANGKDHLGFGGAMGINSNDAGEPDSPESVVNIDNVLFLNNLSPAGGAIGAGGDFHYSKPGSLNLNRVAFVDNRATTANNSFGTGGALNLNRMNTVGTQVYFLNNHAEFVGGAAVMVENSTLNLDNSVLVGNTADTQDDLIHKPALSDPDPVFTNSQVAYNGGGGSGTFRSLIAIPSRSFNSTGYLTYVQFPYDNPVLSPGPGPLANRGGYAAGTAQIENIGSDTLFTLASGGTDEQVTLPHAYRSLADNRSHPGPDSPTLPSRLQAEDFNLGGQAVGYFDRSNGNSGGAYRTGESVDLLNDAAADNQVAVTGVEAGEWLEWRIRSPGGQFIPVLRYSSPGAGSILFSSSTDPLGTRIELPATGGTQTYQEFDLPQSLIPAGFQTLRILALSPGMTFDYLDMQNTLPQLAVSGTLFSRSHLPGSSVADVPFEVWNSGGETLNFTLSESAGWLSLSKSTGSSSGEKTIILLQFDPTGLTPGTYQTNVTITSPQAINSPVSVTVFLFVLSGPTVRNDFDGDGTSDIGAYFAPGGNWYRFASTAGFSETQFGYIGTLPVTGDFDGDGRADIGCYFPGGGNWYFFSSTLGFSQTTFGFAGTLPVVGDFDGDGVSDFGVYHPPTGGWYLAKSTEGFWSTQFGFEGTLPVVGDFDGDGRDDFGCYHPTTGNWYLFQSTLGFWTTQFGFDGTLPVVGDFDGDGRDDFGCYHPPTGNWYLFKSTEGFWTTQFGFVGTLPVVGDFDGDGLDDFGCYHPPTGNWYLFQSSNGFKTIQFGYDGTVPLK